MAIPHLPIEIYIEILKALPTSRTDSSEATLLNCLHTNSIVRAAALASTVWEAPYRSRYSHCVQENEKKRREAARGDRRVMYCERRRLDREALLLLDELRSERAGRHERARMFTQTYSFDVWDVLRVETELEMPSWFHTAPSDKVGVGAKTVAEALPRRYWAQVILGVIARFEVVGLWARVFSNPADPTVTFEESLAGLSAFFDVSVREVTLQLEDICASCLVTLRFEGVQLDPNASGYDFWYLCRKIRDAIHELSFRLAEGPHFYNLMNQFPHAFLSPHRRETIPMSLVYIFVAVARRLGIQAYPANFPGVVQVHIQPHDPSDAPRLLDMRNKDEPTSFTSNAFLNINFAPVAIPNSDEYTRPATPDKMLARAYNNIIMFMRYERVYAGNMSLPWSLEAHEAAYYATSCSMLLETQNAHFAPTVPDTKPLDAVAVLLDGMAPVLHPIPRASLTSQCYSLLEDEEEQAKVVTPRSMYPSVKYFVGLIFRHAMHQYVGSIYGWHPYCKQSEGWIQEMQVDSLTNGRYQPFYHVLADDGQPRYVAQENIIPISPSMTVLPSLMRTRTTFSRYYTDVEMDEATGLGRLLPSKELRDAFPEDDQFAASWIHGWT